MDAAVRLHVPPLRAAGAVVREAVLGIESSGLRLSDGEPSSPEGAAVEAHISAIGSTSTTPRAKLS